MFTVIAKNTITCLINDIWIHHMTVNKGGGGQFMTVNQNDVHIRSTVFKHNNENIPIMELYRS